MTGEKKYSYIKNPFSKNGWISFGLSIAALILTAYVIYMAVSRRGEVSLFSSAAAFSAIAFDLLSVLYAWLGLREKDRNYAFAAAGALLALAGLAVWVYVML